jgi:hypothetical protein
MNNFESARNFLPEISGKKGLYPERAFSSVDSAIGKLKKLQSGETEIVKLPEKEMKKILTFENNLGTELEEIFKIKVNSISIVPEFLLTEEGKELFLSQAGIELKGDNLEEIEKIIYQNREAIGDIDGIKLQGLEGKTRKYSEESLLERILAKMDDAGEFEVDGIKIYQPITFVSNPEDALEKIQKLRNFKRKLKDFQEPFSIGGEVIEHGEIIEDIIWQYRIRVNEMIVEQFGHVAKIRSLGEKIGEDFLSEDEKKLLSQFAGLKDFVSIYARFDKLIYGAEDELDEKGNFKQIGEKIKQYADEIEQKYIENERTKKQKAAEKGLDLQKIKKNNISKDVFTDCAEECLDHYGQKSSMPADQFNPKRAGSAPDGKWQFVPSEKYSLMDTDSKQKVIKAPSRDRSVLDLMTSLLGHEFAHFVQALNQNKLKLKLYERIGGDRRLIFAEGGAMLMQSQVSEEIFGFKKLPIPNFVKAMAEKIKGGNYLDCVKAFYDCSLKIHLETENETDQEALQEKKKHLLGVSIRSCKRLFKPGENLIAKEAILSKSKDTVYIEQLVAMEKLKEAGMEKFAMIRGLNPDSLCFLLKNGFIKETDIETLDLDFIKQAWEKIRGNFILEN